jgi:large subunit ribosomal protein L13
MRTTTHVRAADVEERWLLFDASKHNLGRMAARIATSLMGKDRPTYTPSEHGATHIVVINSAMSVMTGAKNSGKEYQHYTGYPGGRKVFSTDEIRVRRPNDIVTLAVRRMLPKNRLGKKMLSHLKVYPGAEHPHMAQQPNLVETL